MIRTSLMLSAAGAPPKCLLVTSPQVGGGKSFISLNLALVYAQMGAKVLLLDCDLRKPRLHRVLEVASNPGLSNFLTGKMDLKTITKLVGEHLDHGLKLDFISSGATPPNPVELLNSNIFSDNLEQLKESYDMIIIDSPPLLGFADPLVLSRVADGTLLVIRNEQTPRPVSRHACDLLYQVGANILGAVVNDIKVRKGSYYYGKYYSYYHYYGKEYSKDRKPELTGRLT
jgi:capsular exopolysaccharide synthesis family protein